MTAIRQNDLIESVAAALQYISYYHPADYIAHLARAYALEQSPAAKDAIAQILTNSTMSATGHRPICQDTGIVNVFLKVGMDIRWEGFTGSLDDASSARPFNLSPCSLSCHPATPVTPENSRQACQPCVGAGSLNFVPL